MDAGLSSACLVSKKIFFKITNAPGSIGCNGILAVNTAKSNATLEQLHHALFEAYQGEQFISVLPVGQWPQTANVLGSNVCEIGVAFDEHAGRVVVVSAIDNLVKGTAGAAIQSLNVALGFREDTGLAVNGVAP